jgi:hypothetical protein
MSGRVIKLVASAAILTSITIGYVDRAEARAGDLVGLLGGQTIDEATQKLKEMADKTLADFLKELDAEAKDLLERGANAGSLLGIQASNSMLNLTATIRAQFSDEMNKQVASVSTQMMPFLIQLERWHASLDKLSDRLVSLEDLVALDMLNLPFTDDSLFIRRVYGGVFVQDHPETYYLDLLGRNFGGGSSKVRASFNVLLDGQALSEARTIPPYDAVFSVPVQYIDGRFDEQKIVSLPLDVTITRTTERWWDVTRWWAATGSFPKVETIRARYWVSLLPNKVGTLTVRNKYLHYEWQKLQPIVPLMTIVKGPGAIGPYDAPTPVKAGIPGHGSTKIDPDSISCECVPDMEDARDFGKGRVLPLSHDIFAHGFRSTNNCGSAGDRAAAYATIDAQFKSLFNFTVPLTCQEGEYAYLLPDELLKHSTPTKMDVSGCPYMKADPDPQWEADSVGFRVELKGTPFDPVKRFFDPNNTGTSSAKWSVRYQLLTYLPTTDLSSDPDQTIPVTVKSPAAFFVMDHLGQNATTLTFTPRIGSPVDGPVGPDLVAGVGVFKSNGNSKLGDRTQYRYEFQYPNLNLNHLRQVDGL